jgi:hypothetical protein
MALQSTVGGVTLSFFPPLAGAAVQEVIDIAAAVNAVRTALQTRNLSDY